MATYFAGAVEVIRTVPPNTAFDPNVGPPPGVRLDGDTADIVSGGEGLDGDIWLRSGTNQIRVHLGSHGADFWLGGQGVGGDIILFPSTADSISDPSQATIHLDGQAGDIKILNADFAEDFDVDESDLKAGVEPGTVMILSEGGRLRVSSCAYDQRVAGVVSGARGFKPGIVLDRSPAAMSDSRVPLALGGKVYCRADASYSSIKIGDMLTTSDTPGYAMRAIDPPRAFGSVIGKALQPLSRGRDLISILVALQ